MPAWELERDNSEEDFENDEREEECGPVDNDEEYDEDEAEFYREANRQAARRGAFPKYDPNQPLHF